MSHLANDDMFQQASFDNVSQFSLDGKKQSTQGLNNLSSPERTMYQSFQKPQLNVNTVDLMKMEKLNVMIQNLFKSKKVFKAFINILNDLK